MKKINKNIACQDLLEIQGNKHEKEKFQNAMEIVKNFPVTKSMFPEQPYRGWQVCSK